jgi:hypothetical protein
MSVFGVAQVTPSELPVSLNVLLEGIGDPDLVEIPTLTQEIQRRGVDFDPGKQLSAILSAASKGKRDPEQVAALVTACLEACQDCRARLYAPLTTEELRALLKSGFAPGTILQEVRARGVKDLEISEPSANMWKAAGASDELVAFLVPDDKIPVSPVVGYKALPLKHAEEFDPSASEGWLKIAAELPSHSESEFIFKHNGLFLQVKKGDEPTSLSAYFNKPAPRNTPRELIDFKLELEGAGGGEGPPQKGKPKGKQPPKVNPAEAAYLGSGADGRDAFRVVLVNEEVTPQQYSVGLRWRVLITPKPLAPTVKR